MQPETRDFDVSILSESGVDSGELERAREAISRRRLIERGVIGLLLAGGAGMLFSGCGGSKRGGASASTAALPNPRWPIEDVGAEQLRPTPSPLPRQNVVPQPPDLAGMGVIPRTEWARGDPIRPRMNLADRPFNRITVHHDGIDAFTSTSREAAARRVEQIRQSHLNRRGEPFGDIGYHYVIDPAGRVWQGRDTAWQGAHVAKQNEGNLGICVLGNYNRQSPNRAQCAAVDRFVKSQMSRYGVMVNNVKVHRDLAQTECPGASLHRYMIETRRRGMSATA
ncbi:MAG: peptidoglycan recognition family protein [Phycisphaerales bacterium]